ncbi:TetR/AcrR family transcriptional regulator [Porphyromonas levii]|uniref:TetR/AcrR family transcriptional regulator n=1 Tax=Porphyromonas levii TaxID=28114 RepID=A0A4Y8WQ36_9PORP|nr:TetR/AcrR family transcriptional regulator [Porphyromonas levii]TFH95802.1 TetR/AcrR family transcriptional regulator [Porphyromonas levii]TFH95910.1 TetR/AcrR family transcriptional regulator [Porphyromonas levii]
MAIDKTRLRFIEVARRLFAEQGYHATTMNAIAVAAGKGRRTLYNYFGTKSDVYLAVIQEELQTLYEELKAFISQPMNGVAKLMLFIAKRQRAVNEVVQRNGTLQAEFFNDIATVERARMRFDVLERQLIQKILIDGINDGSFRRVDVKTTAMLLHACLKGLEVPFIRGQLGKNERSVMQTYRVVRSLLMEGIQK